MAFDADRRHMDHNQKRPAVIGDHRTGEAMRQ